MQRRSFIKLGLTSLAGMSMLSSPMDCRDKELQSISKKEHKITYRILGKTGLKVPIVSMGVMNADNPNIVAAALDAGIVLLDTAHSYQRGRNEKMIGKVIKGRPRDSFIVATKVQGKPRDRKTGSFSHETKGETFLKMCSRSIERLGLEYVDILSLHGVMRRQDALFEPLLRALETAKKDGKARFVGITTHSNEPEVIQAAIDSKVYDVVLTAYNFKQKHNFEVKRAIANAAKAGLGVIAMKTQAGVYWDKIKKIPINMKAALKWVLNDTNVHTAIPGFTTFDQLEEDLSVMDDLTMTEQEKLDLKLATKTAGLYCQQCKQCLPQCKQGLPVPSLMRSYMYVYGYKNVTAAYDLLKSLDLPKNLCKECDTCSIICTEGFNIKERVMDIVRLQHVPVDFFT